MVRVLLTSHGGMAQGMAQSVRMLIGNQAHLVVVTFDEEMGAGELEELLAAKISAAAPTDQWLVFCDLKGGTPFNVVSCFSYKNEDIAVVYGMNLPIVIEALMMSASQGITLQELLDGLANRMPESIGVSAL